MRTHTKTFHIRLTEQENNRLTKNSEKCNLPKSTYIRHMINGIHPKEQPPPEYFKMIRILYEAANNLNHTIGYFSQMHKIDPTRFIQDLKQLMGIIHAIKDSVYYFGNVDDVNAALERGRLVAESEQSETGGELQI